MCGARTLRSLLLRRKRVSGLEVIGALRAALIAVESAHGRTILSRSFHRQMADVFQASNQGASDEVMSTLGALWPFSRDAVS